MKERGILFTGDMVRAILDGTKTQTRRPMKPQPMRFERYASVKWVWPCRSTQCNLGIDEARQFAPHGKPGDAIYVRETFQRVDTLDGFGVIYRADGTVLEVGCDEEYEALPIDQLTVPHVRLDGDLFDGPWVPSIHMPKGLSRIRLPIVNVRVERIQDITPHDALTEGVTGHPYAHDCPPDSRIVDAFRDLWEATYPGSWERNDWVWVYEWNQIKVNSHE